MTSIRTDELGRTFEIPIQRVENHSILSTHTFVLNKIATLLSTSLGPNGMDKIIQTQDDEIVVTNDGATILESMCMTENPISKLIVELSKAQDDEIGDGTTSVVILANSLLKNAEALFKKGVHKSKIAEGYEMALELSLKYLHQISEEVSDVRFYMEKAAKTSLNSKITGKIENFAKICADAVYLIADKERKDLNFDRIRIEKKIGNDLSESVLINGVVLNKEFSHPQMRKEIENAKIAILTCPFELPKLKNKNDLLIKNVEDFKNLENYEIKKFKNMIEKIKEVGANVVINQWGFEDEANSLLMENNIPAIRWVGGSEMEAIALHSNGSIVSRFENLTEKDLGTADLKEISLGTESEKIIVVENKNNNDLVTILIRGSTDAIMEEAIRSVRDALCAARNVLQQRIVYGGGSFELTCSDYLEKEAVKIDNWSTDVIMSYGNALEEISLCLAKSSGYNSLEYVEDLKNKQKESGNIYLGVDCDGSGNDMKIKEVFDSEKGKAHLLSCATQLVLMILKIDDVVIE